MPSTAAPAAAAATATVAAVAAAATAAAVRVRLHTEREGLGVWGAVHQCNGRRLCVHLPLGRLIEELFLPLQVALYVPAGCQAALIAPLI